MEIGEAGDIAIPEEGFEPVEVVAFDRAELLFGNEFLFPESRCL